MSWLTVVFAFLWFAVAPLSASAADPSPNWKYVEKKLKKAGLKPRFIKRLHDHYETKHFHQVLELNVLLYLRKSDYHGVQVSDSAAAAVRDFMQNHHQSIRSAKKRYGVDGSVIASLLWMESRHGVNTGSFHVPSVYLHLLQADRPEVVKYLQKNAKKFTDRVPPKEMKKIAKRTREKAKWALAELKAVQTMQIQNPKTTANLRGSFAGAFGIPQFLPSSYVAWAKSAEKKRPAELERPDDAIMSVAHYLYKSGWKKSRLRALMRYNNSRDYARAILKLAAQTEAMDTRAPAEAE